MAQREIKFRAWHENAQNWVQKCDIPKCFVEKIDCCQFEAASHIKLMQFTGKKDTYGADIYEGDVVEIVNRLDRTNKNIGTVKWSQGEHIIEVDRISVMYCPNVFSTDIAFIKIIGNIYDKPELLTIKNKK